MRIGFNPHKDLALQKAMYLHQIVVPVYIPHHEGYFAESFNIFQLCLNSIFQTVHSKTFISIIDNGCCQEVKSYLNTLFQTGKIHEVIHTDNIGKLNAILKGIVGNDIELVTISDSDVLFLSNWQLATTKVFQEVPKAGVVGLVPQFKMYQSNCGNLIFDKIFSSKLKFVLVKNKDALIRFYDSLGWDRNYNQDYLKYTLGLQVSSDLKVLVGSGHFVATYKKDMFDSVVSYIGFKMGGNSEGYLDKLPLEKDYWRLTTYDNFAYHMGNKLDKWMAEIQFEDCMNNEIPFDFHKNKKLNAFSFFIKNRLFPKLFSQKQFSRLFLRWKGLPREMVKKY